ncbi:MAG: hypothetical protein AAF664_04330 [Planctomycetota bacterium]
MSTAVDDDTEPQVFQLDRPVVLAYRFVQAGILLSLIWKWSFFRFLITVYGGIPIDDQFFPGLLRHPMTMIGALFSVVAVSVLSLLTGNVTRMRIYAVVSLIGLAVLLLHQGTYNDATFTTSFWAALWNAWFVTRLRSDNGEVLLKKASFLSRIIISMILLGGAAGKWTAEYWSGEVLYDIYFIDRDFWTFSWLRERYDAETLKVYAKYYSQLVVVTETLAGLFLWLVPPRYFSVLSLGLLGGIVVLSNDLLMSVMCALFGLALVSFFEAYRDKYSREVIAQTSA